MGHFTFIYPTLFVTKFGYLHKGNSSSNFVPNSELYATARRSSQRVVHSSRQSVINWTVVGRAKLTILAVAASVDVRPVYHTERPPLCSRHNARETARRAGPSATYL